MPNSTIAELDQRIEARHLLTHPFYESWHRGELSVPDIQLYAKSYFPHVRAFPQYLSQMHLVCGNLADRRIIANNLADEEATAPTHPDLWLNFAKGLGLDRETVLTEKAGPRMDSLIRTYMSYASSNTVEAAAALYCYEKRMRQANPGQGRAAAFQRAGVSWATSDSFL